MKIMANSTESCTRDSNDFEAKQQQHSDDDDESLPIVIVESAANTDASNATINDVAVTAVVVVDDVDGSASEVEPNRIEMGQQQHFSLDEIPEPIKQLDDIISAFEDTTKQPTVNNNNGENQSEDDGYMSLSRKNMSKKDADNAEPQTPNTDDTQADNNSFHDITDAVSSSHKNSCKVGKTTELSVSGSQDQSIIQTTLPKAARTTSNSAQTNVNTNYSSLPCCGVRTATSSSRPMEHKIRTGSCNGERNALGIDISAVHNAVLRGGLVKLPETIVNEHPVTIYPGPTKSSEGGVRGSRRPFTSVEKHRAVCHMLNPQQQTSNSNSTASTATTTSSSSPPSSGEVSPAALKSHKSYHNNNNNNNNKKQTSQQLKAPAAEDDYSEDSLEESTVSTDITTPMKQNGIAWEIRFKSNKKSMSSSLASTKRNNNGTQEQQQQQQQQQLHKKHHHPSCKSHEEQQMQEQKNSSFIHNHANMLGKGTFVIRRPIKKPPRTGVRDIFHKPNTVSHTAANSYFDQSAHSTDDSDASETSAALPPPPPPAVAAAALADVHFIYKENDALNTRRSLDVTATQRNSLVTSSPRERLSLNIEASHQSSLNRETNVKQLISKTSTEELTKPLMKSSLNISERRLSAESMPEQLPSSEDYDESIHLNGNSYENCNIFPFNTNGLKTQEYNELRTSNTTTPHTDLAPTLEEDEELSDFSYGCAPPLKQIENNISALLRGDMAVARIVGGPTLNSSELLLAKRPLEFRPGVHKSESAKEMLLSQNAFGPLPPSPPSSNPDSFDYDALPPLPPLPPLPSSPKDKAVALALDASEPPLIAKPSAFMKTTTAVIAEVHAPSSSNENSRRSRDNINALRHLSDELPPPPPLSTSTFDVLPPAVPPHRMGGGLQTNSMKSWSNDSNYRKRSPKLLGYSSNSITTPTGPAPPSAGAYESGCGSYNKRYISYGTKRSLKQSPREEHRLQTSCSLPETPIFARGCDIPRTPYRRQNEPAVSGSRTAPRSSTSNSINMGTSIMGIAAGGGGHYGTGQMCRQRSINHALASNEMLRMTGAPARGWYPKQRTMRPVSTENIDRLSSVRVWDSAAGMSGTGQSRKPLTLPPNLTPSFLNKSPREALRRVTSLLITKKKNTKERKHKAYSEQTLDDGKHTYELEPGSTVATTTTATKQKDSIRTSNSSATSNSKPQNKKKGIFKTFWKRTKHLSLDQ